MTTIKGADVKVGDTVRVTTVVTGTVFAVDDHQVRITVEGVDDGEGFRAAYNIPVREGLGYEATWELERPKPKLGSLWRDPETKNVYAATESGQWPYANLSSFPLSLVRAGLNCLDHADAIARLEPYEELA